MNAIASVKDFGDWKYYYNQERDGANPNSDSFFYFLISKLAPVFNTLRYM